MSRAIHIAEFRMFIPGLRWEDTPIMDTLKDTTRREADNRAIEIAKYSGKQVRWNWKGLSQGHYFGGRSNDR